MLNKKNPAERRDFLSFAKKSREESLMNYQQVIRVNARRNKRSITNFLVQNYLYRASGQAKTERVQPICIFCAATANITSEHVLPRWFFDKDPHRFFNTPINGLSHKYDQTTVPACSVCNNGLLSTLEKRILQLSLVHKQYQNFFKDEEKSDIIRWMEILDYKFQVFSLITKFRAIKGRGVIEYLSDFPVSVLDPNINYSPARVKRNLRQSLLRVSVKSKDEKLKSLITFQTRNTSMHFFHKGNDFLFLELPKYELALLYFCERVFENELEAKDAAMEVIGQHY